MKNQDLAAEVKNLVSEDRLSSDLEALCQWERFSGTEGEWEAARFIQRRLGEDGIPVTLHKFESYLSLPQEAELEALQPERKAIQCLTHSFGTSTDASGVEGDAVLVDKGGNPAGPLEGKVALIDGMVSPGTFFYEVERQGAIAQVYSNIGDLLHDYIVSDVWGTPTPETAKRLPRTPVASITRSDANPLIEALRGGRNVRLRLRTKVDTRWRPVEMPEAVVRAEGEGSGSGGAREFLLIHGHLDSWYTGAMDNASGNALLMELARIFQKLRASLRRDLRVAFWSGHSHGRYAGSGWYADQFWDLLREGCVGQLNVDQVGFRDGRIFRTVATSDIAKWVQDSIRDEAGQDVPPLPVVRYSDMSFWGLGVPSFSFRTILLPDSEDWPPHRPEDGLSWYLHRREDTPDKIDRKLMAEHVGVQAAAVSDLLSRPLLPLEPAALGEKILSELEGIAGDAFDLGPPKEAAAQFLSVAKAFQDRIAAAGGLNASQIGLVNHSLLRISQKLNCVMLTVAGPYHQDLATPLPLLPALQPARDLGKAEEPGFLHAQLLRERNRLVDALRDAEEIAERALSKMA